MKKVIFTLALFLTCSLLTLAQKGISYQAVILDPKPIEIPGQDITGQPFVNGEVSLKFKLFSSTFVQEFEEVHVAKTDGFGLVNVLIGSINPGAFSALVWDNNPRSMQVWVSFDNGGTYTKVSEQQLTYNPYAIYAETASKLSETLSIAGGGTGATTAAAARTNLGLGNVDNTADAAKPISTATQAALDTKANANEVTTALGTKANAAEVNTALATKANAAEVNTALATKANASDVTTSLALKEDVSNKANTPLGTSTSLYPTQNAVKTYVDAQIASATIADASSSTKGKIQLAGDLAGTAAAPTVPGLALKANASEVTTALAVKADTAYVLTKVAAATIADASSSTKGKIQLAGDLAGTAAAPTVPGLALKANASDVTTALAVKADTAYVLTKVAAATIADASSSTKGKIQLAGDLAGTAAAPTVPGLALKANAADVTSALATKASSSDLTSGLALKANTADVTTALNTKASTSDLTSGLALKAPLASPTFTGTVTTAEITTGALSSTAVTAPTYASAPQTLTYTGSTINWNPALGLNAAITLTQNSTLSFTAAPPVGSYGTVVLTQDGTGGRTLTLPTLQGATNQVLGSTSTSTVALSTAASAKDILNFYYDGTIVYWNIGQGYGAAAATAATNLGTGVTGTLGVTNGGTGAATLSGLVKGNGTGAMTAAVAGTDYQAPLTLSTSGSGAATLVGTTLTIPTPSAFALPTASPSTLGGVKVGSNLSIDGNGELSAVLSAANISGTLAVGKGGTGATTLTGYVKGTGTTAMTASANIPVADVTGAAPLASPTFTGTVTTATINTGALSATSVNTPIYASTPQALTDATTIEWNPANGLNASVTLGGNRTLSFSSTPAAGAYGTLVVTQDPTGGKTLTLPTATNKVLGSATTTTIALSTAANAIDIVNFYYDGNNYFWNVGQGYGTAATVASTNLTSSVSGTLPIANGGTGASTQQASINALTGTQSSGKYLRSDGTNATLSTIQAADVPTLNQNTTGTSSNVTGVVLGANGGTGVANTGKTITLGGNIVTAGAFTTAGAFATTFTSNATTSITLPTTGTLATLNGTETLTNKTLTSPIVTGLSLTSGLTGNLPVANGGTGNSTATQNFIFAGPATGSTAAAPGFRALVEADIPATAISYGKIQNITAGKLLGSISSSAAAPGEVAIGSGLSLTNGTLAATSSGTVTSVAALTLGTTGTDINSSVATASTTPIITLNIPDASVSARGVVTTGTQTIAGAKTFSGAITAKNYITTVPATITAASTTTLDFSTGNILKVSLGANITALTVTNATAGTYLLEIIQGGTYTVAFPAAWKWSGGTAPTITATSGKTDIITLVYDGTTYFASAVQNF